MRCVPASAHFTSRDLQISHALVFGIIPIWKSRRTERSAKYLKKALDWDLPSTPRILHTCTPILPNQLINNRGMHQPRHNSIQPHTPFSPLGIYHRCSFRELDYCGFGGCVGYLWFTYIAYACYTSNIEDTAAGGLALEDWEDQMAHEVYWGMVSCMLSKELVKGEGGGGGGYLI